MPNLYDALTTILREHWKHHDKAYPQRIELSPSDVQTLYADRKLVNDSMNFKLQPGWEDTFHGVPVQQAELSAVVDVNGQRIAVTWGALPSSENS